MAMAGKTKITCRVVKPSQALCWTFVMSLKTRVFISTISFFDKRTKMEISVQFEWFNEFDAVDV